MSRERIEDVITGALRHLGAVADRSEVTSDSRFRADLKIDSLDEVELVIAVEDAFGIHISDDDLKDVETVAELAAVVERYL